MSISIGRATRTLLLLLSMAAGALGAPASEGQGPRVLAIGDVHGESAGLREILRAAELIDDADNWLGFDAVLVQTGDFLDRGADVRGAMDLLMSLQEQSHARGGRVEVLLGNHEAMNLFREYRDVGPEAYASFEAKGSEKLREQAFKEWRRWLEKLFATRGRRPQITKEIKKRWLAAHPPGMLEYREALDADGRYGEWLRARPLAVQVGDSLFVHGGVSPSLADRAPDSLNLEARESFAEFDRLCDELIAAGVILPFFDRLEIGDAVQRWLEIERAAAKPDPVRLRLLEKAWSTLQAIPRDSLLFRDDGPLWYRGYSKLGDEELAPLIGGLLEGHSARRIVVAHTPSHKGRIESRLEGKVFLIDTGMLASYYRGGRPSALEILDSEVTAIYPGERSPPAPFEIRQQQEAEDEAISERAVTPVVAVLAAGAPTAVEQPRRGLLDADGEPLPFASDDEILEFLETAEVVEQVPIGEGVTHPDRLVLESAGLRLRAAFHDVHEIRQTALLRGQGAVTGFRDSYFNNPAAYQVSRLLGMDNVPPSVVRKVGRQDGSVTLWIESSMTEKQRLERGVQPPDPVDWLRRFYDMRVFDNLIDNSDRNQGNILVDSNWKVWLIDHTRAFSRRKNLGTPGLVVRCSGELYEALRSLDSSRLAERLKPYLGRYEIKSLLTRRDRLLELLDRLIAEQGAERVLFTYGEADPPAVVITEEPE